MVLEEPSPPLQRTVPWKAVEVPRICWDSAVSCLRWDLAALCLHGPSQPHTRFPDIWVGSRIQRTPRQMPWEEADSLRVRVWSRAPTEPGITRALMSITTWQESEEERLLPRRESALILVEWKAIHLP